MASLIGHSVVALCIRHLSLPKQNSKVILFAGIFCSVMPDIDVIGFKNRVAYESFGGHLGFTHSLLFTVMLGVLIATVWTFIQKLSLHKSAAYMLFFTLCTASHGVLNALTNGGRGVAFFSPWDNTRYFFPWRPILVTPIGVMKFFSMWGLKVLISELIWIGLLVGSLFLIPRLYRLSVKHG